MAEKTQNLQNHTKLDPPFHMFLLPVALVLLIKTIVDMVQDPGWPAGWHILFMVWATIAMFKIRIYALKVQDRVIRLEERLRMQRLLPAALQGRIVELSEGQCVALRFASDAELPAMVEKTLSGSLNQKQIKQAIQSWRPDYFRV